MSQGTTPGELDQLPTCMVGVAGPWPDADTLFQALVDAGEGRYAAGEAPADALGEFNDAEAPALQEESDNERPANVLPGAQEFRPRIGLIDRKTQWFAACQVMPHNPHLEAGLQMLGRGRVSPAEARRVAKEHRSILMLGAPGGSLEAGRAMLDAAATAIRAGGLGVVIESSGVAHTAEAFLDLAGDPDFGGAYWAFVATIGPKHGRTCYTCGLHNLGFRDAITDLFADPQEAAFVMHSFLGYAYQSGQPVANGDGFGDDEGNFCFRAVHEPCRLYERGDPFHNPYGMWRIVPMPEEEWREARKISVPPPQSPPP